MKDIGREEPGYGLYSYATVINNDNRSKMFLARVFSGIPSVKYTAAQRSQTNIFYVPLKNYKEEIETEEILSSDFQTDEIGGYYARNLYDYKFARTLLNHLCESPAKEIEGVCEADLSRGPYIFAYAKPASKVTPVPPPFLFIDLSDVHERAFPEFIAAFRAQVKREDISDRAKIDTLRLRLLSIALTGADWVAPVQKAIADVVHSASGQFEKDKK
ncbi:MAG: hypothetical protein ACR2KT_02465 [Methylocella sp.]|nr:MAG: hypothetical protein DLM68_11765 [Hyphomicrobiales bacterium]